MNYRLLEAWKHRNKIYLMNHNRSLNLVWSLLQGDFAAPDIPKSMAWCENSICVGFKRDYYLIRVSGGGKMQLCLYLVCFAILMKVHLY